MNCKVYGVYKNLRYRILVIDGQTYILDLGNSIWKILFPLFYWILPNPVYKVNDQEILDKLKTPEVHQTSTGSIGLIGGGLAVIIANLMKPLTDYFDIQSTPFVNTIIVIISVILLLTLRFYINQLSKNNLYRVVELEKLPMDRLLIKPKPIKHFTYIVGMHLFFLVFTMMLFWAFINYPNVMILFISIMLFLVLLFIGGLSIMVSRTEVKFKD